MIKLKRTNNLYDHMSRSDSDRLAMRGAKKNFWKATPLGRTLSLRNKTGKALLAAGVVAITSVAGIGIDPVIDLLQPESQNTTNMDFLQGDIITIILGILGVLLSVATAMFKGKARVIAERIASVNNQVRIGYKLYLEFREKDSEGGQKISPEEALRLVHQFGAIFQALFESTKKG